MKRRAFSFFVALGLVANAWAANFIVPAIPKGTPPPTASRNATIAAAVAAAAAKAAADAKIANDLAKDNAAKAAAANLARTTTLGADTPPIETVTLGRNTTVSKVTATGRVSFPSAAAAKSSLGLNPATKTNRPLVSEIATWHSTPPQTLPTQSTKRFLFIEIAGFVVRFHIDEKLSESELEVFLRALETSCLKWDDDAHSACVVSKMNSVEIPRNFLADVRASQSVQWSNATTPLRLPWKLKCLSRGSDCLSSTAKVHSFMLVNDLRIYNDRVLAHGIESQSLLKRTQGRADKSSPGQASAPNLSSKLAPHDGARFDKVYLSRSAAR